MLRQNAVRDSGAKRKAVRVQLLITEHSADFYTSCKDVSDLVFSAGYFEGGEWHGYLMVSALSFGPQRKDSHMKLMDEDAGMMIAEGVRDKTPNIFSRRGLNCLRLVFTSDASRSARISTLNDMCLCGVSFSHGITRTQAKEKKRNWSLCLCLSFRWDRFHRKIRAVMLALVISSLAKTKL